MGRFLTNAQHFGDSIARSPNRFNTATAKHVSALRLKAMGCDLHVLRFDFNAYTVSSASHRREHRRTRPNKRINNRVLHERKHPHQAVGKFEREGSRMLTRGCTGNVPELLEPLIKFGFLDST